MIAISCIFQLSQTSSTFLLGLIAVLDFVIFGLNYFYCDFMVAYFMWMMLTTTISLSLYGFSYSLLFYDITAGFYI